MPASESLLPVATRFEEDERLDPIVRSLRSAAAPLAEGPARPILAGRWLGHALHPLLTDFPLGFWASASLLDLVGGRGSRTARRRLVGLGVLAALPTAAAGASDWAHTGQRAQRVGVVHAAANTAALFLYVRSYVARRRGHHALGALFGFAGGLAAVAGGFFGGHLSLTAAVTRDNALMPPDGSEPSTVAGPATSTASETPAEAPVATEGAPPHLT